MKRRNVIAAVVAGAGTAVGVGYALWLITVPGEYAAVVGILTGVSAGLRSGVLLERREAEIDAAHDDDRPMWTQREFERDLSPHQAWTHERPWWARRGGRR